MTSMRSRPDYTMKFSPEQTALPALIAAKRQVLFFMNGMLSEQLPF